MFALMLFMFFFFLGSLAMFLYLLGKIDKQTRTLNDEHAQLRVLLRAMESRLEKIAQMERLSALFQGNMDPDAVLPGEGGQEEPAGHDPLLHLSFDNPKAANEPLNPGLSLDIEPGIWTGEPPKPQA